ncbi:uncharacterized protein LOC134532148 isoform X2 [Bacillus rossius redtenbacheri]|uniref:uncharacterized protein LOC134532148 isoform X2 n=1 Tax=Bacillus rossius redtenbacheri TaxID=93214 RepID=UPI002FDD960B
MCRYLLVLCLVIHCGRHIRAEDCDASEHVTELEVTHANSTTIGLAWKDTHSTVASCVDRFVVSWCLVPLPWSEACAQRSHRLASNHTSYVIGGLQPCSYYWVSVAAERGSGATSRAEDLVITAPVAHQVRHLATSYLGGRQHVASWGVEGDDSCVRNYRVCWRAEDDDLPEQCNETEFTNYLFPQSSLRACTNYTIMVATLSTGNYYSLNTTTHFVTGPDNVGSWNITRVSPRGVLVAWEPSPSRCAERYMVRRCLAERADGPCGPASVSELDPTVGELFVNDLEACALNVLSISTWSADRESPIYQRTVEFQLDEFGPPTDVEVTADSDKQFTVSFGPPRNASFCVLRYEGCFRPAGAAGAASCSEAFTPGSWTNTAAPTRACAKYEAWLTAVSRDNRTSHVSLSFSSPPAPVERLRLANASATPGGASLLVTWQLSPDNTCATGQLLRYSSLDDEDLWTHQVALSREATSHVVTDLAPCTLHILQVAVLPESPVANTSTVRFFSASNVTTVAWLRVLGTDERSANVSYLAAEATPRCVAGYEVCWEPAAGEPRACQTRHGSGETRVYIGGLHNCSIYLVSATPVAPDGDRYTPTVVSATTAGCAELPPRNAATGASTILGARLFCHVVSALMALLLQ